MKLTAQDLERMAADPAVNSAAAAVFLALTHEKVMREVVEPIQDEVLAFYRFQLPPDWVERYKRRGEELPEYITRQIDYLLSDEDLALYCKELHTRHVAAGRKKQSDEFGLCPLLIAESNTRQAKRLLCDLAKEYTGLDADDIICSGIKNYNKYIELLLQILAPKAGEKAQEIMKGVTA